MDDYEYKKIDRKLEAEMEGIPFEDWETGNNTDDISDWNPRMTNRPSPLAIELVPIGEYDGNELLPGCYILDNSYTVYMEVTNQELTH